VFWKDPYFGSRRSIGEGDAYTFEILGKKALRAAGEINLPIFFANSPESRGNRVNNLLVQCPD